MGSFGFDKVSTSFSRSQRPVANAAAASAAHRHDCLQNPDLDRDLTHCKKCANYFTVEVCKCNHACVCVCAAIQTVCVARGWLDLKLNEIRDLIRRHNIQLDYVYFKLSGSPPRATCDPSERII